MFDLPKTRASMGNPFTARSLSLRPQVNQVKLNVIRNRVRAVLERCGAVFFFQFFFPSDVPRQRKSSSKNKNGVQSKTLNAIAQFQSP